jgi:hypothetical protein
MDQDQGPLDDGIPEDETATQPWLGARRYADDDTGTHYRRIALEPSRVYEPPPPRRSWGDRSLVKDLGLVLFVVAAIGAGVVTWGYVGDLAATHLLPPSHAPSAAASSSIRPSATPAGSPTAAPSATPSPTPTATPKPVRKAVNVSIEAKPKAAFVSEQSKTLCAAAAVQIALNVNGSKINTTAAYQSRIHRLLVAATTRADSRNGGSGPQGMVATLNRLGGVKYELRTYKTRPEALFDTARAISATKHAVILLAWRGAHAWVMTGYRANADPRVFKDAKVTGTYVLDPWYPRVSSIWGRSDPPGTFQDAAEMRRNYLPWRRPEGKYPARDGKFLAIVPVAAP